MGAPREITLAKEGFTIQRGSGTMPACWASRRANSSASLRSSRSCFSRSCCWRSCRRSCSRRLCSSCFLRFISASVSKLSIVKPRSGTSWKGKWGSDYAEKSLCAEENSGREGKTTSRRNLAFGEDLKNTTNNQNLNLLKSSYVR